MKNKIYFLFTFLLGSMPFLSSAQVVVNEYSFANWRNILNFYQDTEDWVELYNAGSSQVNLEGYFLSDNENKPTKWSFPANSIITPGGFMKIWCSGRNLRDPEGVLHTNFKFTQTKANADHIVFSNAAGVILEDIKVEKTQVHQSRGRLVDGGSDWRIFPNPSIGVSNTGNPSKIGYATRPSMSETAGFYPGPITLEIKSSEIGATIRYTLDGSEPSATSPIYTTPLTINKTTVVKAVGFSNNTQFLPSFTQFNTYFIAENHTLAVVSVGSADVITLANGNKELRPLGSIEYFDKTGDRKTRTYGELNSHGQDSWANDQRSLDWVSRDEMGYNHSLEEKLFPLSDRDKFQRIILRASGDDNYPAAHHASNEGSAHVRDAYIQNLAKRGNLDLDVRISEKCIVYLNGQYWGVYDMREIPDDHDYTDYYYGQGKFDLQYVLTWGNTWAEYGGDQAIQDWRSLRDYIFSNNMADPVAFKYVDDRYDYKSLIDYIIVNSFTVCTDWLNYNTGIWRGLNPEGEHRKWGYILWDNDATFDFYINYTGLPSTEADALPCNPENLSNWSDPEAHMRVLDKLRDNPEVNQFYLARQADLMYTVFGCDNMLKYLDTIQATIDPEMTRHAQRWFGTYNEWKTNINRMRNFISQRCNLLPTLMDDCYDVEGPFQATILVDPPGAGTVKINTLQYKAEEFPVNGHYFSGGDIDLELHATPDTIPASPAEYRFHHWSAKNHTFSDPLLSKAALDLLQGDTIIAHFVTALSPSNEPGKALQSFTVSAKPTLFDSEIQLNYFLPEKSTVSVRIFDVVGNLVHQNTVLENTSLVGDNNLTINLKERNLSPGVYFLRFSAGGFEKTIRLIRI